MGDELRKLRQVNACATEEEILRLKHDLAEARCQIKSLQVCVVNCRETNRINCGICTHNCPTLGCSTRLLCVSGCSVEPRHAQIERDRAEEGEKEQRRLFTSERDKRVAAERDLESERDRCREQADKLHTQTLKLQQLRRESDHATSRALSTLHEQLRREVTHTIDEVCDGASRLGSGRGGSPAFHSDPHSDVKRLRTSPNAAADSSFTSPAVPSRKGSAAPYVSQQQRHNQEPTAAAARIGFSTVPETLDQSDSLGLS